MSVSAMVNDLAMNSATSTVPSAITKVRPRTSSISGNIGVDFSIPVQMVQDPSHRPPLLQLTMSQSYKSTITEPFQYMDSQQPIFHNYLRAFYPFTQTYAVSDTTVVPLNEGDVVLIHSIHTNGWADGTLLSTGARGWLPTNFCEPYDSEPIRNLLSALLNFWDLLRSGVANETDIFSNQEFMRGIVAGVRCLLLKTNCLTRESPLVRENEAIRRHRKALLSDLSVLVKKAKIAQRYVSPCSPTIRDLNYVNDTIDEMMIKAFRITTCAIRFLDLWEESASEVATTTFKITDPTTNPLHRSIENALTGKSSDAHQSSDIEPIDSSCSPVKAAKETAKAITGEQNSTPLHKKNASTSSVTPRSLIPRHVPGRVSRHSISHRLTTSIPFAERQGLVSEKLNCSHDTLLSFLGSFIGRLHIQSQSSADLIFAIQQFVNAGNELLVVVGAICDHDYDSMQYLKLTKDTMENRIQELVDAAQDILQSSGGDAESAVMPEQKVSLLIASTGCVKAAGECVAKTKFVIERIGDFEIESPGTGNIQTNSVEDSSNEPQPVGECELIEPTTTITAPEPNHPPPPPPPFFTIPDYGKPLPQVPAKSTSLFDRHLSYLYPISPHTILPPESPEDQTAQSLSSASQSKDSIVASNNDEESSVDPCAVPDEICVESVSDNSIAVSSDGSRSKSFNSARGSESSFASGNSTRATTPDHSLHNSMSLISSSSLCMSESRTSLTDEAVEVESKILEKTFAHELLVNKERGITGGTLPALVERLTTHDSTPDSLFVSTFYLTFRLFVTPIDLAKSLIDRFEYVALSSHIAGPVRLRVYNVFKGWLESHWQEATDHEALTIIQPFASETLSKVLPAAGKRLMELTAIVSSTSHPVVPRMVSSIGKITATNSQYTPTETTVPPSIVSKTSMSSLKNWRSGGNNPIILDFDPLELARHLTMMGIQIFCSIQPEELLGSEWTKGSESKAPNVRAMATLSTDISYVVADTILQFEDVKKRANVIKHWIKIAHQCLELKNYDSLMAIICSLNSSTIIRLKKTWDAVSVRRKELLKSLQVVVEPDKNHANLRRRLHDHVPPCLPFVGMYLTDLTFVDAGNASTRQLPGMDDSDGLTVINFDKHTRTAKIISELQRFQMPYRLAEVPELKEWIQAQIARVKTSLNNEQVNQFYRKSLLLEPREPQVLSRSPTDASFTTFQKDKFDIFGWATKERSNSLIPPASSCQ